MCVCVCVCVLYYCVQVINHKLQAVFPLIDFTQVCVCVCVCMCVCVRVHS